MCGTSNLTGPKAHNIIYPYNIPIIYINNTDGGDKETIDSDVGEEPQGPEGDVTSAKGFSTEISHCQDAE